MFRYRNKFFKKQSIKYIGLLNCVPLGFFAYIFYSYHNHHEAHEYASIHHLFNMNLFFVYIQNKRGCINFQLILIIIY